jgi:sulfide:quinone oxidoreductase
MGRFERLMKREQVRSYPKPRPRFDPMANGAGTRNVEHMNGALPAERKTEMHVVIAGGGVAALEAVMALRDMAADRVKITLVAPDDDFLYRPMSVGEPFALGDARRVPLKRVARDFDVDLVTDGLASVSPGSKLIRLTNGGELRYDKLIVATGARRQEAFEHVTTFRGQEDSEAVHGLIQDMEGEYVRRVAFVVPTGTAWSLPIYELALMAAQRAHELSLDVELTIVTPEEKPLSVFGPAVGDEVGALLDQAGIKTICSAIAEVRGKGVVLARPGLRVHCDRIVALPRLEGASLRSLPHDADGFIPIDNHGRVAGIENVYAAGDGTNFPVKQGGIACQQADAVAEVIAKSAGAPIEPRSFRPVLRGQLLTGGDSHFMRTDLSGRGGDASESGPHALWWPPSKVAGRYLAPYLHATELAGTVERQRQNDLMTREYAVTTA